MIMADVTISNVRKFYGAVEVLRGIDLLVENSEFVALVGPSGCGKSTLLRMIAGLEGISDGQIAIGGRVVNDVPPKKRDVAMVFQNYALYPHMTVAGNMGFALKLAGTPKQEIDRRVGDAAAILDLTHLLDRLPKQLSGGQRQRVAMGRAIVRAPQVFLFDEPLSNLDAKLRVQMRAEIKALHQRLKTTTVYVTHDQVEAMTMADKIVVMRDGVIEQVGSPLDLYDLPRNMFVAGFIGSPAMNFIDGTISDGSFVGAGFVERLAGLPTGLEGRSVVLGVRPEHLELAEQGHEATVKLTEQTGSETNIHLRLDALTLNCLARDRIAVEPGQTVHLRLQRGRTHLFDKETGQRIGLEGEAGAGGGGDHESSKKTSETSNRRGQSRASGRSGAVSRTLEALGIEQARYRPELHYMRGPGPKSLRKAASIGIDQTPT
jgi:multiple sugar transport system ATP-binding protein